MSRGHEPARGAGEARPAGADAKAGAVAAAGRSHYRRPAVTDLGSLENLTLGGSPGLGDSGNTLVEQPPGGPVPPFTPGG